MTEYVVELISVDGGSDCLPDFYPTYESAVRGGEMALRAHAKERATGLCDQISGWAVRFEVHSVED